MPDEFKDIGDKARADAKRRPGRPTGTGGPQAITRKQVTVARQLFLQYAEEAAIGIAEIARDPDADPAVRLRAYNSILDRAFGTPISTSVQMQLQDKERESPLDGARITAAATEDLQILAQTLTKFLRENAEQEQIIDITPMVGNKSDN